MPWEKANITIDGQTMEVPAPDIISASRCTDIPAFYADWFFHRLQVGYSVWQNPFNRKRNYISYQNTRFIVFWSKNPKPLLPYLPYLKEKGIGCYIQFTLNDYEADGLESGVPPLRERIETFKRLSGILGKEAVIWRFDPLILTDRISTDTLLEKIERIGTAIHDYTEKLVFSFADISAYKRVRANMAGIPYREWDNKAMEEMAAKLSLLNRERGWNLELATCAEPIDLEKYGIAHNRCVDGDLIARLTKDDKLIRDQKKDPGQRAACGCVAAKDIGQYDTCPHLCAYCYANVSKKTALANWEAHQKKPTAETITGI